MQPARSVMTPYLCTRCLLRQSARRSLSSAGKCYAREGVEAELPPPPPSSGAVRLIDRGVVLVKGQDAAKFLQGLLTNEVLRNLNYGYFAAVLNPQGKLLNDVFVYPVTGLKWATMFQSMRDGEDDPGFFLDVDRCSVDSLLALLKKHKLRSKFKFRAFTNEIDVWNVWRGGDRWTAHAKQAASSPTGHSELSLLDSRAPGMGKRMLILRGEEKSSLGEIPEAPFSAYKIRRYLNGIPEGQDEMPRGELLPMNCNIDLMGGIDFQKGCYNGQELTIRTHHTGVVRRRILPLALYDVAGAPPNKIVYDPSMRMLDSRLRAADIRRNDQRNRSTGSIIASMGNIGLGMCRLEMMTDLVVSGDGSSFTTDDRFMTESSSGSKIGIKAFVPDWLRGQIRTPKVQRRID